MKGQWSNWYSTGDGRSHGCREDSARSEVDPDPGLRVIVDACAADGRVELVEELLVFWMEDGKG